MTTGMDPTNARGARLRRERRRRKLSMPALAQLTGHSDRSIGRIERGERDTNELDFIRGELEEYFGLAPYDPDQPAPDEPDDVRRLSDGALWAKIHELHVEAQNRYFHGVRPNETARAAAAPSGTTMPLPPKARSANRDPKPTKGLRSDG